jgi:probable addiction module antidote protein
VETRAHRLATSSAPGATGKIKGVGPVTSNRKYEEILDEDLQNPAEAAQYLSACLESGEPEVFLLALRDVARARGGVAKLAELTELNREHLYRMLSENGNPELRSLETLLDALGFRLAVALKEAS